MRPSSRLRSTRCCRRCAAGDCWPRRLRRTAEGALAMRPASLSRRIATLRSHVRSLQDASLVTRMLFWRLLLPVLKRLLPLPALARLMSTWRRPPPGGQSKVIELAAWLYGPRALSDGENCLDRSLLLYRYLAALDPATRLLVGFRPGEDGVEGHAWVAVGQRRLGAHADEREFVPTLA